MGSLLLGVVMVEEDVLFETTSLDPGPHGGMLLFHVEGG